MHRASNFYSNGYVMVREMKKGNRALGPHECKCGPHGNLSRAWRPHQCIACGTFRPAPRRRRRPGHLRRPNSARSTQATTPALARCVVASTTTRHGRCPRARLLCLLYLVNGVADAPSPVRSSCTTSRRAVSNTSATSWPASTAGPSSLTLARRPSRSVRRTGRATS